MTETAMAAVAMGAEAGDGVPSYLGATAALVAAAAMVGYLSVRARVVPIVGFLIAGLLIGPAQLSLGANEQAVEVAAEVGVTLLLFTIGIELSLARLAHVWRWIVLGGGDQVLLATAAGVGLVAALGGDWRVGVFTGFLIAPSPTAIVLKLHLKICPSCGNVGCCDSSPGRHARAHHDDTDYYPIAASAEPGETWAYCFFDDITPPPRNQPSTAARSPDDRRHRDDTPSVGHRAVGRRHRPRRRGRRQRLRVAV